MFLPVFVLVAVAFADAPTVDQLVEQLAAARKATAAARAKEDAAAEAVKAAVKALNVKLKDLGLDPVAPEPAPPPKPVDPLAQTLRAAYSADASPGDPAKKREALADLVETYKQAVALARTTELTTASAVIAKVKASAAGLGLTPSDLVGVRTAIGAEIKAAFPADVALDAAGRDKLAGVFARVQAALAAVQP